MSSAIYQLNAPISVEVPEQQSVDVSYINIFKVELETKRANATMKPYILIHFAACDANGTEIMVEMFDPLTHQISKKPLLASVAYFFFDEIGQEIKDCHKNLIELLFGKLQLNPGQIIQV